MIEKIYTITRALPGRRQFARTLALVAALLCFSVATFAQGGQVTGKVIDTDGNPLLGVAVVIPGTSVGVTTNLEGAYNINVPEGATEIRFTYLGYADQTVAIEGRVVIDITMGEATTEVEEVVVIGYGVQKKRDLTGAVASVGAKVLEAMPVATAAEAITGRMAGVLVTSTEGGPDADIKIRVRGGGSITQDNSPLYIVDGFPVNSINDISSSDILSIDVLKDASSTAIYGARGANGVVIVSTKSGQDGSVKVNFNAYAGIKELSKTLDVMDPYEYVLWQYELANYRNSDVDGDSGFAKYYGVFDDLELYKYSNGTNWQKEVFGRTAVTQNYNLSVSGGSDKLKFNIGLARLDDQSIMIGSGQVKNNISVKLNAKISPKLSIDFNSRWSHNDITGAGTSTEGSSSVSRLRHALKYRPVGGIADFVAGDDDLLEELENQSEFYNPVDITNDEYRRTIRRSQAYNAAVNWKIIKGLTYRLELGIEEMNDAVDRFYGVSTGRARQYNGNPVAEKYTKDGFRWRIANTVTWMPKLGDDHDMTLMLGQETNSYGYKEVTNESREFAKSTSREQALALMNLGTPQPTVVMEGADDNMLSFFGRANYSLKDKYLLTATLRADGSSKFAPGHRWGYFPSVAVGWRLSDEPWLASTRDWLPNLKLRASYGAAGNNRIPDDLWKYLYYTNTSSKPIAINNQPQTVLILSDDQPNTSLKWETTVTRNIGLDFGLWRNRLTGTLDVYWNTTKDLLIRSTIPSSIGFSRQYMNIGETSNKGIELTLDGTIIQKQDFRLGASFNIAFNRNKIEDLGGTQFREESTYWYNSTNPDGDFYVEVGKPIGQIYGYITDGYYTIDDFNYVYDQATGKATWTLKDGIASSAAITGSPEYPGTLKLRKLDGSGDDVTAADRTVIGNTLPKATGGFNINAQWKGFDVAAYFNYSLGNDVYNANKLELTSYPLTRRYGNLLTTMEGRFTYIDRNTGESLLNDIDRLRDANANASIWSPIISRVPVHSWAVEDGSFLRLSNVTIGYTLPKHITRKIMIETLRVYVTGYNLALITNYSGFDPEVDAKRSTPLTPGVDYSAFPRARTFVAGVNITF